MAMTQSFISNRQLRTAGNGCAYYYSPGVSTMLSRHCNTSGGGLGGVPPCRQHRGRQCHVVHAVGDNQPTISTGSRAEVPTTGTGAGSSSGAEATAQHVLEDAAVLRRSRTRKHHSSHHSVGGSRHRHSVPAQAPAPAAGQQAAGGIGGTIAVALVAGAAVLVALYRRSIAVKAHHVVKTATGAMVEGAQQKKLQHDAQARLNDMSEKLRNLPSVDLSGKNLLDEGTAYVVEGLAFSSTCRAVNLSQNGVHALGVAALAQVLPTCGVQTLVLSINSIGDDGTETLAKSLSGNSVLLTLDLAQNGIGDRGARALGEALRLNTTLTRLDLTGNAIDVEGATALAAAIADNNSIEVLSLSDNYIGEKGALALAEAVQKNKSLRELHIKGNELGDAGVSAICSALAAREVDMRVLELGNNSITEAGAEALAKFLTAKPTGLKELILYMNDISDTGVAKLAKALPACKSLATLDLGGNNIGVAGCRALAESLKGHEALATLELGYNPLGPEGVKALGETVKYNLKALRSLKLGWCKVSGGDGARVLADLLMFNNTITAFDLRGNGLGNDGAIILARGLRSHDPNRLAELDLGYNEIKDDGACALAQALKANPEGAPKVLKLNSNYITRFGQVALQEAVDMVLEMAAGKVTSVDF